MFFTPDNLMIENGIKKRKQSYFNEAQLDTYSKRGSPFLEEIENMNIQRGDEEVSQRQK